VPVKRCTQGRETAADKVARRGGEPSMQDDEEDGAGADGIADAHGGEEGIVDVEPGVERSDDRAGAPAAEGDQGEGCRLPPVPAGPHDLRQVQEHRDKAVGCVERFESE